MNLELEKKRIKDFTENLSTEMFDQIMKDCGIEIISQSEKSSYNQVLREKRECDSLLYSYTSKYEGNSYGLYETFDDDNGSAA